MRQPGIKYWCGKRGIKSSLKVRLLSQKFVSRWRCGNSNAMCHWRVSWSSRFIMIMIVSHDYHNVSVMPGFLGRSGRRILKKADSTVSPQFYHTFVSFHLHHICLIFVFSWQCLLSIFYVKEEGFQPVRVINVKDREKSAFWSMS